MMDIRIVVSLFEIALGAVLLFLVRFPASMVVRFKYVSFRPRLC